MQFIFSFILLCALASIGYFFDLANVDNVKGFILSYGVFASLIYIIIHVCFTIILMPTAVMSMVGGVIFGPYIGIMLGIIGIIIGASVTFWLGRHASKNWILNKISKDNMSILNKINKLGWKFVVYVRFTPLIPFDFLNYAISLTNMKLKTFLLVNTLCMIPSIVAYNLVGSLGFKLSLSKIPTKTWGVILLILIASGIMATFIYLLYKKK